jgi:glycosyltransferase involved in cell wall biosynthesis
MPKVLYVCHSHPSYRPGGAEIYAAELYEGVRGAGRYEPLLVTKAGPPVSPMRSRHAGTRFALLGDDPNVYLLYTDRGEFDALWGTAGDKRLYTRDWPAFLEATQPDVVHFQHTLFLGYDLIRATRNTLPGVPIVYTLHEFLPICHHSGQMVRTRTFELCDHASPQRCHRCFPEISQDAFLLRERYVKAAMELVDLFVAPSEYLRERYVEWGLRERQVIYEENGRAPAAALPDPPDAGRRRRIGFFGQVTRFKGLDVLLEATRLLRDEACDLDVLVCGAHLDALAAPFKDEIGERLAAMSDRVRFRPGYSQAELPWLMSQVDWVVVPSIWWENSPLVIQEALMHRRPIITGSVGGMAEKVRDGVDGLHFVAGDARSLADVVRRAVSSPELWDRLRAGLRQAYPMAQHVETLTDAYHRLTAARTAAHGSLA